MDSEHKKDMIAAYKEKKKIGGICAIRNCVTGKMLIAAVPDIQGFKNRFSFSQATGACIQPKLSDDWNTYGSSSFSFEIMETLEKKELQTDREFAGDIAALKDLWMEKTAPADLY